MPLLRRGERIVVAEAGTGEEGLKVVIVGLGNRVELMVVAAGAADRQAQEYQSGRLGDVVEGILPAQSLVVQVDHVGIAAIEPGGDEGPGIVGPHLVAGELQADELVVGQVAIQRLDHPVAISPGVGPGLVELEAVGFGEPRQVEPVLSPTFAKLRAREQPVDQAFVALWRAVGQESTLFLEAWRQAGQVEAQAPQEGRSIGFGGVPHGSGARAEKG